MSANTYPSNVVVPPVQRPLPSGDGADSVGLLSAAYNRSVVYITNVTFNKHKLSKKLFNSIYVDYLNIKHIKEERNILSPPQLRDIKRGLFIHRYCTRAVAVDLALDGRVVDGVARVAAANFVAPLRVVRHDDERTTAHRQTGGQNNQIIRQRQFESPITIAGILTFRWFRTQTAQRSRRKAFPRSRRARECRCWARRRSVAMTWRKNMPEKRSTRGSGCSIGR